MRATARCVRSVHLQVHDQHLGYRQYTSISWTVHYGFLHAGKEKGRKVFSKRRRTPHNWVGGQNQQVSTKLPDSTKGIARTRRQKTTHSLIGRPLPIVIHIKKPSTPRFRANLDRGCCGRRCFFHSKG